MMGNKWDTAIPYVSLFQNLQTTYLIVAKECEWEGKACHRYEYYYHIITVFKVTMFLWPFQIIICAYVLGNLPPNYWSKFSLLSLYYLLVFLG